MVRSNLPLTESLIKSLAAQGVGMNWLPNASVLPPGCRFEPPCSIKWMQIGHAVELGAYSYAVSGYFFGCSIGRYTSIGESVQMGRGDHPTHWLGTSPLLYEPPDQVLGVADCFTRGFAEDGGRVSLDLKESATIFRPIRVGHDVWIGHGAFIRPGVTIGDGAVVGAQSVVTRDVPPYAVVAGSPARIRRMRFSEGQIERLQALRWWQYSLDALKDLPFDRLDLALDRLEERVVSGAIKPYTPKWVLPESLHSGNRSSRRDTVALYYPDEQLIFIRDSDSGEVERYFKWHDPNEARCTPIFGDWFGTGESLLGLYDPMHSTFTLFADQAASEVAFFFYFGPPAAGWIPLAGDWNGDGRSGIGLFDPVARRFLLKNELVGAPPDEEFIMNVEGQVVFPLVGDWDGDGKDEVGLFDPAMATFSLIGKFQIETRAFPDCSPNARPLAGDWWGLGYDIPGIYEPESHRFTIIGNEGVQDGEKRTFEFSMPRAGGYPLSIQRHRVPEAI